MSYAQALSGASRSVWPGCGDGRERWCGRVHDYRRTDWDGTITHDFRCWRNSERGCPQPLPEVRESVGDWNSRREASLRG